MGIFAFADRCLTGIFGFIIKVFLMLLIIAFAVAGIVVFCAYWPFTVSLVIGLLLSLPFYRWIDERTGIGLPDYFFMTLHDLFSSLYEGDRDVEILQEELESKLKQARYETEQMHSAVLSLQEEYEKVKKKKSLKNLFSKDPYDISPRMAKALEMELGRPKWAEYVEKASQNENGDWEKYRV